MPSLFNGMNVTLGRAALKARTYSKNNQRDEMERGSRRVPRKVQAGEWV